MTAMTLPAKPATGFDYTIKRSRRKTLGLYVREGEVEVRAPLHTSDVSIHQWVNSKAGWVSRQLQRQAHQAQEKPRLEDGGHFLFMGQMRELRMAHGKPAVFEQDRHVIVHHTRPSAIPAYLEKWLRCEAELYLVSRTQELAEEMDDLDRLADIRFRKTRSKWGHCTSAGVLQFNWLIIMAPPGVIDYLIIHELSHLRHMNHSHAFWQRVARFCPDFRRHKQWLNDNGHRLWL